MLTRKKTPSALETVMDEALDHLSFYNPHDDEYGTTVDQLVKLNSIKATPSPKRVSPDTLALVGANLAGIAAVLWHEQAHVVASKALGLLLKAR
jgi:hypothetical protein